MVHDPFEREAEFDIALHELSARHDIRPQVLRQVSELVAWRDCQTAKLAAHFGETLEKPCGHSSGCLGDTTELPPRSTTAIPPGLADAMIPLMADKGSLLDSPRALARFLCGVASPKLSHGRLGGHALLGALAEVPFAEVMAWVEALPRARSDPP